MRRLRSSFVVGVAFLVAAGILPARARAIDERPVTFVISNTNTSAAPCASDGKQYVLRGTITAPAGLLESGAASSATLYLHGSGDASSWHFTGVPNYDHIGEMAELGHVSVFIHSLGYGASDRVDGTQVCFGSLADATHQVVTELRSGRYSFGDASVGPAFRRVALAAHSGGGLVAELEAVSYHDIDALIVASPSDFAFRSFAYRGLASFAVNCARGGDAKEPGGPRGWAYPLAPADVGHLFFNADPAVIDSFRAAYERDFCAIGTSIVQSLAAMIVLGPTVHVPVLLVYGDHDIYLPGAPQVERLRFLGSKDVALEVLPDSGHVLMLQRTAPHFRATMSEWLAGRGF